MMMLLTLLAGVLALQDGNRLTYLDESDPYYVSGRFPKLTTPQWVGEPGVEAALIFSIDDMMDTAKYEAFLRPLLDRLKKVDGRAPVSILTCKVDPRDEQLQRWLVEGLSLDNHTATHPHPLLRDGDFAKARANVDRCTDMLFDIPNNRPVAFRMPWCDVLNTQSPRFFAEIFNQTTASGRFLTIDSSVFTFLPPRERYQKYLAHVPNFVNWVDDYPYPYVIGRLCWEFPGVVPDDSVAQRLNKANSPATVEDMKATIDAVVGKQGTWTLVFHPHNWIKSSQLVELVDHAVEKHGRKALFLNFREAQERIDRNLLGGHPLRRPDGGDNGVRVLDVDGDGFVDVVIGNARAKTTRIWKGNRWEETPFPVAVDDQVRFGIVGKQTVALTAKAAWRFEGDAWKEDASLIPPAFDRSARLRDATNDGTCELLVGNDVYAWSGGWKKQSWGLPKGTAIVDREGRDAGLRFVDVNADGYDDVVFSNDERYSVHLFLPRPNALRAFPEMGWSRPAASGRRGDPGEIPPIVRQGTNNGAWFHSGKMWVQNEDTTKLPDHCDQRTYRELMVGYLPPALAPDPSLKRIRLREGFTVELVAAEPLVHDPVAFDWGADGRLWVVEMLDYPMGIDGKGRPGGKVRVLEDTDGDGRYDRSTVFIEGLSFPTGVMPWRNGVLISAAPDILYAEDTDGDGRADVRRVLFTGFGQGNTQHRVNGFQYGLDNWVYGANGGSDGRIDGVPIQGRDFRFRPDDRAFEPAAGVTEFGRNRDDWGNWFGNNHPTWGWHYWLPEHYLPRNPALAVRSNKRMIMESDHAYRLSSFMARPQMARPLNFSTSPSSVLPYRDDLFGAGFATSVFICEVDKNIVHREILEPDGVSFKGRRAPDEKESEFLASTDNWFRPTMAKTGPDGALYIADMYRLIIEHQEYYPRDTWDLMDFRAGSDRGRIYRVVPTGSRLRKPPRLDRASTIDRVAALVSPNGWQRDTAQRLLVHEQDPAAVEPLRKLARGSGDPRVRVQALCTLDGLRGLTTDVLAAALKDDSPKVREQAVRLSEPFLRKGEAPDGLLERVEDPEVRVRFQLAFTLGEWKDPRAGKALASLAARPLDEPLRIAILSSAMPHLDALLPVPSLTEFLIVHADLDTIRRTLGSMTDLAVLAGCVNALDKRGVKVGSLNLEPAFERAKAIALDPKAPEADRRTALGLLDLEALGSLLDPRTVEPIQSAALDQLGKRKEPQVADLLLARWKVLGPGLRAKALDALLTRSDWSLSLLAAIEGGAILPGALDPTRQQQLRQHAAAPVRERAAKVLSAVNADREKVVREFQGALQLEGNAAKGLEVFRKNCASCHRLRDVGHVVGPDLAQLASKPAQELIVAVLDPNRNIAGGYAGYLVATKDDRDLTGVISAETGNSVTLRMANGVEEVIPRDRIRELRASTLSLMPEGLEKTLTPQDLADLLAFIRGK
jgi:putative membrane-bound dehydrogenase-like protein